MVKSILIARVHDGLHLSSTIDDDDLEAEFPEHKAHSRTLVKKVLPSQTEPRCTLEANDSYYFHVLIMDGIAFICLTERLYPKRLAYTCLDEVSRQFFAEHSLESIMSINRPYALVKYTNTLQRIKRSYQDVRARQNIERLNDDLINVTEIMTKSINQLLERGNKLENMSLISTNLSMDAKRYIKDAQQLNWNAMWEKYGIPGFILLIFLICLIVYFKYLK